jgi:hypothetical protein
MGDERTLHCPEGHLITVRLRSEVVDGERITQADAHSSVPWCELCLDMIAMLRYDPDAGAEDPEEL